MGKNANQCGEDFCYDSLVYCQGHTDLVFDEYRMEPTRQEKRPRNTGLDPISMKTNHWYSEPNGEGNDSQISSPKHMNEDSFGIKGSPYQNSKAGCKRQKKTCKEER